MQALRLPASVVSSIAVHAGFLGLYLILSPIQKKENLRMISNVDLLIPVKRTAVPQAVVSQTPKLMNFLKMALPTIPKLLSCKLLFRNS